MHGFEPLIGDWRVEGEIPMEPPIRISGRTTVEGLGAFIVVDARSEPVELPDSLSIIGGAPEGEPQPMHYFDSRGVKRLYLTTVEESTWKIWRAPRENLDGPDGPGFDQRFIGTISADGNTIDARWERGVGDTGITWQLDFPLTYVRASAAAKRRNAS